MAEEEASDLPDEACRLEDVADERDAAADK